MAKKEPIRRLGILGGTFNPPHMAHLAMACAARDAMELDRVFLMTTSDPPHKPVDVPAEVRHAMVVLATKPYEGIYASAMELRRPGKSYTVDTLRSLRERYPNTRLYYIVGGDMLEDLSSWWKASEIFRMAEIIAVPRNGIPGAEKAAAFLQERCNVSLTLLPDAVPDISSTSVRMIVRNALPTCDVLLPSVEAYIYESGLYFPPEIRSIQESVRAAVNQNRYTHTMGVVRMAIRLAERYGVDGPQARLTALLHDGGSESCSHTAVRPDMDRLSKLIYLADRIEPNLDYPGVEELRALAETADLDTAFTASIRP